MKPKRPAVQLRPSQKRILRYPGGRMGIAAVPGSGKTWTLSLLAAEILRSGVLREDQEVLVVTLVNSAVDNFYQRVGQFVESYELLPNLGYRVRTLHGLAHDIVRERPSLVGLAENFSIADERETNAILDEVVRSWLKSHPAGLDASIDESLDENRLPYLYREKIPEVVRECAVGFIRYSKDLGQTPEQLRQRLDRLPGALPLAEMGLEMYIEYQRALNYRGAVDFDDLMRLALQALETNPDLLARLQDRWPYILEDEAQDSSRLQEEILRRLAGPQGNWVRVGDPNQAIYETFTTANPQFLIDFIHSPDVSSQSLPESGRSTLSIINLANELVRWTQEDHLVPEVRDALRSPPLIKPTLPGDPQANPPDQPDQVFLYPKRLTPEKEIQLIADSLARYLPEHTEATVAVLAPTNHRGSALADELRARRIDFEDSLLRSSSATRLSVGQLTAILSALAEPGSATRLAQAYRVWHKADQVNEDARKVYEERAELIHKLKRVEDYLYPGLELDWLAEQAAAGLDPVVLDDLETFRQAVRRWQAAVILPIDQLVLLLAQELLTDPTELAITYKLAGLLQHTSQIDPTLRLPDLAKELGEMVRNERRMLNFSQYDRAFDPDHYRGKVVLGTLHKAKGLEWDRVYLMSVNNYDFPSGLPGDRYLPEKWFLRKQLNLAEETLAQLKAALSQDAYDWYEEGAATLDARLNYVRERLRLLYVGITRAKKELVLTWNSGKQANLQRAQAFIALDNYWQKLQKEKET